MKSILISCMCLTAFISQAQTAIIAHKSHSGTATAFLMDPSTNFGLRAPRLVQVIRLNDSTSIEISDHYNGYFQYDTIYKHPAYANYDLNLDSIQKRSYYGHVEYLNFRNSPDSLKQKPPGLDHQKLNKQIPPSQETPQEQIAPKKKKKGNALLFIFLVTGGGLLVFRMVNRIFTPQAIS